MTNTDFLSIPAGRALDCIVATEVMGWTKVDPVKEKWMNVSGKGMGKPPWPLEEGYLLTVLNYSTKIEEAWDVLTHLRDPHNHDGASLSLIPFDDASWFCGVFDYEHGYFAPPAGVIDGHFRSDAFAQADTAPLAICRAAIMWARKEKR